MQNNFAIFGEYRYFKPTMRIICKSDPKAHFAKIQATPESQCGYFVGFVRYELGAKLVILR